MCGLVTVARWPRGAGLDERAIAQQRDALSHRGPDDATLETIDGWVTLGHRRLSIIDLEGARQPLRSEDGRIALVFNGEVYNFQDLRSRLSALGHTFSTAGDGEVIVHGYEQWGDAVFAMLEGMFAVALVDRNRDRLVLVRDRFGIKPLFYRLDRDGLTAASELKAIGGAGSVASAHALRLGAMRMHVPWPLTAFHGIYRLPPGALLAMEAGVVRAPQRYAPMASTPPPVRTTVEEALHELRLAVGRQMIADVPVGAFLSGGVDSTLIVALMRELTGAAIHTFSIKTLDHDESDVAAATARVLGTQHHTIELEHLSFDALAELPWMYDEPFAETSALGVRALSRAAREHVKVALSGDGGDEVFGGYDSYRWLAALGTAGRGPRRAMSHAAHRLLVRRRWPASLRRGLRGLILAGDAPETAQRDITSLSWAAEDRDRDESEQLSEQIEAANGLHLDGVSPSRRAMFADRLERLPNAMLAKVDAASMSASLEVRVPMLDDRLVRYADRIPIRQLVGLRRGKMLLREVLAQLPARDVAWDRKRGFALPLERWMESPAIAPRFEELLGDQAATLRELTGVDVPALWSGFRAGHSRFSQGTAAMQLLWFATVALWANRFGIRTVDDDPMPIDRVC